jgi:mono/diheme cytochrome c family protein
VHRGLTLTLALLWLVPIAAAAGGDPDHGKALFLKYCSGCHGTDGRGGAHTFMPHVGTLTKKGYIENVPDEFLILVIAKGGATVGKSGYMPAWESTLDRRDMLDIISHIRSLPTY